MMPLAHRIPLKILNYNEMKSVINLDIKLKRKGFHLNIKNEIPSGIVGIYGPSGHGKTTLLNVIAGIVSPDEGNIRINDEVIYDKAKRINIPPKNRNIGYVFQEDRLFPHMSILKNLKYGKKRDGHININEVIEILGIGHLLNKNPKECSGGERQRVALGRVLLSSPKLVLLDEPFSAVDVILRESIIPYLININRKFGIPMLVVSHDLSDLLSLTNYLILLNNGKVTASGLFRDLILKQDNIILMQGTGICNAFNMSVSAINESNNIVILKSPDSDFVLQAMAQSFRNEIIIGDSVKVLIRPEDVAISLSMIDGISLRNQIKGVVEKVFTQNSCSFCLVNTGERLLVEITEASRKNLNLDAGQKVFCLVKSVALKIY